MSRRMAAGLAAVLTASLTVGGCGGGGGDGGVEARPAAATSGAPEAVRTDAGADGRTIRVGVLADLSGPFAVIVRDIVQAQRVYWDGVNRTGGIAGRQVEVLVEDTRYDVAVHRQRFEAMRGDGPGGVLIISHSTGSPHTAAIRQDLKAAHMIAIPLSFYSAMPDPDFGRNVFETYTNFCFESINALDYLAHTLKAKRLAIATFPGEYGQDGAKGAKLAAERLGLEVVYDGEAQVIPPSGTNPSPDNSAVVASIAAAKPDLVWTAVNPATLAALMGQAAAKGYDKAWSGNFPSYDQSLLDSDVRGLIDRSFYLSNVTTTLGTDVPGMTEMVTAIKTARPDARPSDHYVFGWTEARATDAILRAAAASGDLTRAGVERAAFALGKVDFGGLAPAQTWSGDPDGYIVRESYVYKPRLALRHAGPIGVGSTGTELLKGPFASEVTKAYDYATSGACFKTAG